MPSEPRSATSPRTWGSENMNATARSTIRMGFVKPAIVVAPALIATRWITLTTRYGANIVTVRALLIPRP